MTDEFIAGFTATFSLNQRILSDIIKARKMFFVTYGLE